MAWDADSAVTFTLETLFEKTKEVFAVLSTRYKLPQAYFPIDVNGTQVLEEKVKGGVPSEYRERGRYKYYPPQDKD